MKSKPQSALSEHERQRIMETGDAFIDGAVSRLAKTAVWVCVFVWVFALLGKLSGCNKDDSDTDRWNRSGLKIHTDAKTGIQYFTTIHGGMHVRLDTNGQPMRAGQ